jgi:hypothetical protein
VLYVISSSCNIQATYNLLKYGSTVTRLLINRVVICHEESSIRLLASLKKTHSGLCTNMVMGPLSNYFNSFRILQVDVRGSNFLRFINSCCINVSLNIILQSWQTSDSLDLNVFYLIKFLRCAGTFTVWHS